MDHSQKPNKAAIACRECQNAASNRRYKKKHSWYVWNTLLLGGYFWSLMRIIFHKCFWFVCHNTVCRFLCHIYFDIHWFLMHILTAGSTNGVYCMKLSCTNFWMWKNKQKIILPRLHRHALNTFCKQQHFFFTSFIYLLVTLQLCIVVNSLGLKNRVSGTVWIFLTSWLRGKLATIRDKPAQGLAAH